MADETLRAPTAALRSGGPALPRRHVRGGDAPDPKPGRRRGSPPGDLPPGLLGLRLLRAGTNLKAWLYRILMNTLHLDLTGSRSGRPRRSWPTTSEDLSLVRAHGPRRRRTDPGNRGSLEDPRRGGQSSAPGAPRAVPDGGSPRRRRGFSYKDIADITDTSIGTVMSRLHRGRKALQKALWDVRPRTRAREGRGRRGLPRDGLQDDPRPLYLFLDGEIAGEECSVIQTPSGEVLWLSCTTTASNATSKSS